MDDIHKGYGKCEKYLEKLGKFVVWKKVGVLIDKCMALLYDENVYE